MTGSPASKQNKIIDTKIVVAAFFVPVLLFNVY